MFILHVYVLTCRSEDSVCESVLSTDWVSWTNLGHLLALVASTPPLPNHLSLSLNWFLLNYEQNRDKMWRLEEIRSQRGMTGKKIWQN